MVNYEPVNFTINTPRLAKIILDKVVWHHDLSNSIVLDKSLLFTLKY